MKKVFLFVFTLFISLLTIAQTGIVEGSISDALSGLKLSSATVQVVQTKKQIAADINGKYSLKLDVTATYTIKFSAVGYATKVVEDVRISANQITYLDIVLNHTSKTESAVEVRSSLKRESTASLIALQKNTAVVAQVISAEAIRRSPDKNTGEVLKRVPGASVQEGKFLVVRGLSDRYNQAMLNGVLLSSTEPDKKSFSFDIFPSSMIENIVMNKTFIPELPGEWAGGLVQVQTKDVPSATFLNVQFGTGFNTNTIGKNFLQSQGGKLDWLGIDDGTRALPSDLPLRYTFSQLSPKEKTAYGKLFRNNWTASSGTAPLNINFQLNGGASSRIFGKKVAGIFAITYNNTNKITPFENNFIADKDGYVELNYMNKKYSQDVLVGGLANVSLQFNNSHRISFKNIININTSDYIIDRYDGRDFIVGGGVGDRIKAIEIGYKQNTFFNTQISGEHNLVRYQTKINWYGGFNILDQYIPDQRRLFYTQDGADPSAPYIALIGLGAGQKSGSIFYSFLNDYLYNAGGDVAKTFKWNGNNQVIKAGYLFQVKDRLFDCRPFFINTASNEFKQLGPDQIFSQDHFGVGNDKAQFDEIGGNSFRYLANTILNATYVQLDNTFNEKFRLVWGVRFESFDQLVGSVRQSDPRHVNSVVNDFLPGINFTYKPTNKINLRLAASQTVVRPEFRELSPFAFYDFELGAQVVGNKSAQRTKVSNIDLRFEVYPNAGELLTLGCFFKHFDKPIEYYFNRTGPGTNTFNILNTDYARDLGVEFEFRKKLDFINPDCKAFTFFGNASYIYSIVKDSTATVNRPLQGQSPYLLNFGLQFDLEESGFSSTVLFNQIGRRILFVGNEAISDIWENPRGILDLQLAKKVLKKKGEVKLNINDVLNQRGIFYHDLDNNGSYNKAGKDVVAIKRNYGTNISISFSYNIK